MADRCNLRCTYCMQAGGLDWLSRQDLLSYRELLRLCTVLTGMGIGKIRITGGEPFIRKDLMGFLDRLRQLNGLRDIAFHRPEPRHSGPPTRALK